MKLNTCRLMLLAVAIGAVLAAPAWAAPVFVDFGDSAQQTPAAENYNHIFMNDTDGVTPGHQSVLTIANMIDNTGAPTGIGLTMGTGVNESFVPGEDWFIGSNTNGTTAPTGAAAVFHAQATRDNAFGYAAGVFGPNPPTVSSQVHLTGLDPSQKYNFTLLASRVSVGDNREGMYTVSGLNSGSALLDAANNTSNVARVLGISPTLAGNIDIRVEPGPANNNGNKFYYLGAMRIVPEPASGMLLLLGGVSVFMVQRHRGAARRS